MLDERENNLNKTIIRTLKFSSKVEIRLPRNNKKNITFK